MADVRLVDLEVIKRYSLAIRQETAPAVEVLAALDASRAAVLAAITSRRAPAPRPAAPATRAAAPVKKAAAKKAAPAKKAAAAKKR
jgi:hypothetical protein